LKVHGAELPALGYVALALLEAALLFFVADGKPILEEADAGADQHALKFRTALLKLLVLGLGAEAHDVFHAGAVVPAAVEQHHLAGCGQVLHIALKVPL
jgi:hypothetical protein